VEDFGGVGYRGAPEGWEGRGQTADGSHSLPSVSTAHPELGFQAGASVVNQNVSIFLPLPFTISTSKGLHARSRY